MINFYDNLVIYVDYFIFSVIDQVCDKKVIVFYVVDYGELINECEYLYGMLCELVLLEQFCVLMMVWMLDKYLENLVNVQVFVQLKKEVDMKVLCCYVELYDIIMGCFGYILLDGGINENNNWCYILQVKEVVVN